MRIKNLSAAKIVEIKRDLAEVINRHSLENGSDTPDFVLADVAFYSLLFSKKRFTSEMLTMGPCRKK